MAILIVGGYTVPVRGPDGVQRTDDEIGGNRQRMFSGLMRQTVRSFKQHWTVTTRALTASERTSLYSALRGTPPVTCSGDVLGASTSCITRVTGDAQLWTKGQIRYVVTFDLFEQ